MYITIGITLFTSPLQSCSTTDLSTDVVLPTQQMIPPSPPCSLPPINTTAMTGDSPPHSPTSSSITTSVEAIRSNAKSHLDAAYMKKRTQEQSKQLSNQQIRLHKPNSIPHSSKKTLKVSGMGIIPEVAAKKSAASNKATPACKDACSQLPKLPSLYPFQHVRRSSVTNTIHKSSLKKDQTRRLSLPTILHPPSGHQTQYNSTVWSTQSHMK